MRVDGILCKSFHIDKSHNLLWCSSLCHSKVIDAIDITIIVTPFPSPYPSLSSSCSYSPPIIR
jgi:hypothetical protein